VEVFGKGMFPMDKFQVGDKVRVNAKDFEFVYGLAHQKPDETLEFIQIHVSHQKVAPLELTDDHVLDQESATPLAVKAGDVRVGDTLLYMAESQEIPVSVTVSKISKTERKGVIAPLTPSGKIVVNSILASNSIALTNYLPASVRSHLMYYLPFVNDDLLFHAWFSPYRMLCMGVSKSFGEQYEYYSRQKCSQSRRRLSILSFNSCSLASHCCSSLAFSI
jgi:hypothetical protein